MRDAFRALGHDAWSCDLLAAQGNHYQCDVLTILNKGWDLAIFHPPCTYLTVAAEWAYGDGPYHQKIKPGTLVGAARREARLRAIELVVRLLNAPIARIALENPKGAISRLYRKPDQIIQPYDFGDDASKQTCLWTKALPNLTPTIYVPPRIVNGMKRWANQTDSGQNRLAPSEDRWAERLPDLPRYR